MFGVSCKDDGSGEVAVFTVDNIHPSVKRWRSGPCIYAEERHKVRIRIVAMYIHHARIFP